MDWLERTELLIGKEKLEKLNKAHVMVAGLGGVGSWCAEMLARAGVGKLTIIDGDTVHPTNRNRQLQALKTTEGMPKSELMEQRLMAVNPGIEIRAIDQFLTGEDFEEMLLEPFDYVVDAIDTLSPKVFLIRAALNNNLPLICSMGAGGKLDPAQVRITDISKSYQCTLARMVRKRLTKLGIKEGVEVIFSPEPVDPAVIVHTENEQNKKTTVGTISYMPAIFGMMAASRVIRSL
ncbi:MAG: tRNA threonylcarbamoyladenosine dehydratase [Marinilabiliaceae bacterium]